MDEPAFQWWAPYTICQKDRINAKVNARYHRRTHKFRIELLKTVKRALEINRETGMTYWKDALDKEMKNVRVAFDIVEPSQEVLPGYTFLDTHMVFDIKLGSLQRRCRLVANRHESETPPVWMTYSSVIHRVSMRIVLTLATLNGLEVVGGDIQNMYLNVPNEERSWMKCGPEFGPDDCGKTAIIQRALYGQKSTGAAYCRHFTPCLQHLGYESCKVDPDVWMRPMVKADGSEVYEYILVYVDDLLIIGIKMNKMLVWIDKYFDIKDGLQRKPEVSGCEVKGSTSG